MATPNRKRAIDTIDLTGDDDVQVTGSRTSKTPRLSDRPIPSSQSQFYDDGEEDDSVVEVIDPSQNYNDPSYASFELYGTLHTKIVGCRYYNGVATVGEMVVLRREPHNPYDSNAIQVQNVQGAQIGHIPRQMAAKLARYMDNHSLLIEGVITGPKGVYDCPIALKLYGPSEPMERLNLSNQLKADKLPLDELKRREKIEREQVKAAKKASKKGGTVVSNGTGQQWEHNGGIYASGSSGGTGMQSLDDIISESERFNPRNVEQMVEQFGMREDDLEKMPMADQPEALAAKLLPFQRQGLQWLLDKESPQLPPPGSADVVQLWKRSATQANVFTNLATNYSLQNKAPELASGGILADDMGLGKTVQIISLILTDRALKRPHKGGVCNATLILAPLSVMSNWSSQIKRHIQSDKQLRVLTYHGTRKVPLNPRTIDGYDVVITTYETAMSEYFSRKPPTVPSKDGLFSVTWRRIVLDEGHNIRNPAAKKAVAASSLMAQSRWVLTGTPIINTLKDLYSIVKFLRLSGGLDRFELFNGAIIRPVNQGTEQGNFLLQALMSNICLRRKKEMKFVDLRLPELSEYVHRINFLPHEKEKYDALEAEAKGTLDTYKARQGHGGAAAAKAYRHLLEILLRLRQLCNHWKLCGEERISSLMSSLEKQGTVDLTPENREALQQMLQLNIDSQDDCPVCLESLKDPIITVCAHVFCYSCIERVIDTQHRCPMCRADMPSVANLVRPMKDTPKLEIDVVESSSKVEALLAILNASRRKLGNKTVIFSQWTSFLDIVETQLDKRGFKYTRIDGTMPAVQRDAAMEALESDPECTIMLASLGVCSVGLNLVAANQVIMADSWWAPAIEDQAVDRVHRLGQKKPTTVFRLVMEGSIEESVLRIQEDKRKLMMLAFAERAGKRTGGKTARLADIERLLGS